MILSNKRDLCYCEQKGSKEFNPVANLASEKNLLMRVGMGLASPKEDEEEDEDRG